MLFPTRSGPDARGDRDQRTDRQEDENNGHGEEEHIGGLPGPDAAREYEQGLRARNEGTIPLLTAGNSWKVIRWESDRRPSAESKGWIADFYLRAASSEARAIP